MMRLRHVLRVAFVFMAGACGSAESRPGGDRCEPIGKSESCTCDDGRLGAWVCQRDGTFSACECSGPAGVGGGAASAGAPPALQGGEAAGGNAMSGGGGNSADAGSAAGSETLAGAGADSGGAGGSSGGDCHAADVAGCRCPDLWLSYRFCEDGAFGECQCDAPEPTGSGGAEDGTCLPQAEVCDQVDNDCDGLADEGFPCPDDSVWSTAPRTQAAYLVGEHQYTECGEDTVNQVWPAFAGAPITVRTCGANIYRIRRTDQSVFYSAGPFDGIFAASPSAEPVPQPTPSCADALDLGPVFDFDGQGVLHYRCNNVLFRGDGEVVAGSIWSIAGVLDDGRSLVARVGDQGSNSQFVVLSAAGEELSRFPPAGFYTGEIYPVTEATSIEGQTAYVALSRRHPTASGDLRSEVVVYQLDADSVWRFVRRVEREVGGTLTVFADGTILSFEEDVLTGTFEHRLLAYLPDNTMNVVWKHSEASFELAFDPLVFVGPAR